MPYHLATPAQDLMLAQHQQQMLATGLSMQNAKPSLAGQCSATSRVDGVDTALSPTPNGWQRHCSEPRDLQRTVSALLIAAYMSSASCASLPSGRTAPCQPRAKRRAVHFAASDHGNKPPSCIPQEAPDRKKATSWQYFAAMHSDKANYGKN